MAPLPSPSSSSPGPPSSSSHGKTRLQRLIAKHGRRSSNAGHGRLYQIPSHIQHSRQPTQPPQKKLPISARTQQLTVSGYGRDGVDYLIKKSPKNNKKYMAINTTTDQRIHFGHPDYEDFTEHNDEKRRLNYLKRHVTREKWRDLRTPGAWARHLLWSKRSLEEAARAMEKSFSIDITLDL